MKKLIIIFLIIYCTSAYSQTVSYTSALNVSGNNIIYQGSENDISYFLYFKNSRVTLNTIEVGFINYNESTQEFSSAAFNPKYKKKKLRFITSLQLNTKRVILAAFYNQKHKKDYLFAQYIMENGEVSQWKKLLETPQIDKPEKGIYSISQSPNKKKILIYSVGNTQNESLLFGFNINVFDSNFNKIYTSKYKVKGKYIQSFMDQILIANSGEIYVKLTQNTSIKRISGIYLYEKKYTIIHFSPVENNIFTEQIKIPNKYITSLKINLSPTDELFIGGYYSNIGFESIIGQFIFKYKNQKLTLLSTNTFSAALINKYKPISIIDKSNSDEMFAFTTQQIEIDSTGAVYIIGELITNYTNYITSNIKAPYYTLVENAFYDYRDIIICKLEQNGRFFEQRIAKNQRGFPWTNMSFSYSFNGSGFIFVFNAKSKNMGLLFTKTGITKIVALDSQCQYVNEKTLETISECNPLIYKPMSFSDAIYLLNKKDKEKKSRIVKITY